MTFEGARIFVEFDKRAEDDVMNTISFMEGASGGRVDRNLTGSISSEVYVSVKMRQLTSTRDWLWTTMMSSSLRNI